MKAENKKLHEKVVLNIQLWFYICGTAVLITMTNEDYILDKLALVWHHIFQQVPKRKPTAQGCLTTTHCLVEEPVLYQ